jgi:hypothetical protein
MSIESGHSYGCSRLPERAECLVIAGVQKPTHKRSSEQVPWLSATQRETLSANGRVTKWRRVVETSRRKRVEHSPGFFQVARVEAFRKPTVDRGEKFSGLISLPLIAPQPR